MLRFLVGVLYVCSAVASTEVELTNVQINVSPSTPEDIILMWEVHPSSMLHRIRSFDVQYSENANSDNYYSVTTASNTPRVTLRNLRPETKYFATIKTNFNDGTAQKSSSVHFTTFPISAVTSIEVQHTTEPGQKPKLKWNINPKVSMHNIAAVLRVPIFEKAGGISKQHIGYKVYLTRSENLPEEQWDMRYVPGSTPETHIEPLSPGTTFVRVRPVTNSGTVLHSASTFSIDARQVQRPHVSDINLKYNLAGSNIVRLTWDEPANLAGRVTRYTIEHTFNKDAGLWHKKILHDPYNRQIELEVLQDKPIYVKVKPGTAEDPIIDSGMVYTIQLSPATRIGRRRRAGERPATLNICTTNSLGTSDGCLTSERCLTDFNCFGDELNICEPRGICVPKPLEDALRRYYSAPQPEETPQN